MKKTMTMLAASVSAMAAFAQAADQELVEEKEDNLSWRVTVGGMGRGNLRAKMNGGKADFSQVYGVDLDLQYNVWANEDFAVWAGVGGTFVPNQKLYSRRHSSSKRDRDVSEDGFTTFTMDYNESSRSKMDMSYGEFRMMLVPEWTVTEQLSLGARLGVAFDWMRIKAKYDSSWAWNSSFVMNIPGVGQETDTDADAGRSDGSDTMTEFAAQGIVGLQATYMFTDNLGAFAGCDWRVGEKTDVKKGGRNYGTVDMSGWYAVVGIVVRF